jgi:hypothetical protein
MTPMSDNTYKTGETPGTADLVRGPDPHTGLEIAGEVFAVSPDGATVTVMFGHVVRGVSKINRLTLVPQVVSRGVLRSIFVAPSALSLVLAASSRATGTPAAKASSAGAA